MIEVGPFPPFEITIYQIVLLQRWLPSYDVRIRPDVLEMTNVRIESGHHPPYTSPVVPYSSYTAAVGFRDALCSLGTNLSLIHI